MLASPSHKGRPRGRATLLVLLMLSAPLLTAAPSQSQSAKSTTVWSGVVEIDDYTVGSGDVLQITAGTTVRISDGSRIYVDGRLAIEGTASDPVTLEVDGSGGDHEGIQFNSTSHGFGSSIDNLTITESVYGITIYGSDPRISNLSILNADRIGIDLFDYASPVITDLLIDGGGQDIHGTTLSYRYGFGVSIGYQSTVVLTNATLKNLISRGLNFWGSSGGIARGIMVENVSGATLAASAGVWVEDSIPLIEDINVKTSDTGIFVRHISEEMTTRPTFVRATIEDSMYRGVAVDRYYDKSDISNLHNSQAIFEDLVIRGTGGPGAKTPGLGMYAMDVNTSSVRLTGQSLIEDNPVPSHLYMIDSSTKITNLTLVNNGNPSTLAQPWERASLAIRSASWTSSGPPQIHGLTVENSSGVGVHLSKGGVRGSDWHISGSGGTGLFSKEFHPDLSGVISTGNDGPGVSVIDSGNVELEGVETSLNDGAGIWFRESNYVESSGKNVTCLSCSSDGDQVGYLVEDSIDLQLLHTEVRDPTSGIGLRVDNSGLSQDGHVVISDFKVFSNSSTFTIELEETDAKISLLDLNGDNLGMSWSADGSLTSYLNDSVFQSSSSTGCLVLHGHTELLATNVGFACAARPSVSSSFVNFTDSIFLAGANYTDSFSMLGESWIRWISSSAIGTPTSNGSSNILDLSYFLKVFAVNQNLMNIPMAQVGISFDQYQNNFSTTLPFAGFQSLGPFVGVRWLPSGWGSQNFANLSCAYDGATNYTSGIAIDDDKRAFCRLELNPQPPFLVWSEPIDELEVPSGSEVVFSANESFDLDLDVLAFSWTSSIDGDLSPCAINGSGNGSWFVANLGEACLSDGTHQITATLCDEALNCVNETRTITLVNRPPVLSVQVVDPQVEAWGVLYLGQTASVTISLEGTYDVEGPLWCWVEAEYEAIDIDPNNPNCPMEIVRSFTDSPQDSFEVKIFAYDGLNTVFWAFDVSLYNELPTPVWDIQRNGQTSADWISLDGSATLDPEGDPVKFEFWSDRDGLLSSGSSPDPIGFTGTLSKGNHEITFYASDILGEHAGQWKSVSTQISVSNSAPRAIISSPQDGLSTDSSVLVNLDAIGSGDWDISCLELPDNGSGLLCNPSPSATSTDILSVLWQSDQLEEPLGSGWSIQSRLSAGTHVITLTLDDGSSQPVSDSISLEVSKSAPVLVLDSPVVDVVYSNLPVLFDFRNSFDSDGDEFTVTVLSDLMEEPILDSVFCCEYWYNDYLVAGTHVLTFELEDSDGLKRTHTHAITVLETGPVAIITGLENGQYVPPGQEIALSADSSFDFDSDIVLYTWTLPSGEVLSDRQNVTLSFPPGPVRVNLMVQDSRGAESYASINITIGSSAPVLLDLRISALEIEADHPTDVVTTVRLDDPDGTTDTVRGEMISGGISEALYFRDDGLGGDQIENDGLWTNRGTWLVSEGSWVKIEVWAIDGDLVSPGIVQTVPIVQPDEGGLVSWLANSGLPFLIISVLLLSLAGATYQKRRKQEVAKDLAEIERWSSFIPTEVDLEFDEESSPPPPQDPKE